MNLSGTVRVGRQTDVFVFAGAQTIREFRLRVDVHFLGNGTVQIVQKVCVQLLLLLTVGPESGLKSGGGQVRNLFALGGRLTQVYTQNGLRRH